MMNCLTPQEIEIESVLLSFSSGSILSTTLLSLIKTGTITMAECSLVILDDSKTKIEVHGTPKPVVDVYSSELASLTVSADRMVVATWAVHQGWANSEVVLYGPVYLMPFPRGQAWGASVVGAAF